MGTIYIGSARKDSRGKYSGDKAGDQLQKTSTKDTVGEVSMQPYYMHSKGWYMFQFISLVHSEAMAEAMLQTINNPNIGYDQGDRLDIMTALKKYGTLEKITEPTECDCGTLIRACIYQATGIDVGNFNTATEPEVLEKSGLFQKKVSVTSSTEIYNGSILVTKKKGHTVAVVSGNPPKGTSSTTTAKKEGGTYMLETVKRGRKSDSVGIAQSILKAMGYKGEDGEELEVDCSCGANTEYAINCYQEDRRAEGVELGTNGKNDGSCGPKMWSDMLSRLEVK